MRAAIFTYKVFTYRKYYYYYQYKRIESDGCGRDGGFDVVVVSSHPYLSSPRPTSLSLSSVYVAITTAVVALDV